MRRDDTSSQSGKSAARARTHMVSMKPLAKGKSAALENDVDILALVMDVFCWMPTNFWWKVLPDDDEDLDLLVATRLPWDDILPLLIESKLIVVARKKNSISKYEMNHSKWEEMRQRFSMMGERLDYTYYQKVLPSGHQRPRTNSYYVMIFDRTQKPNFDKPMHQVEA
jgi:hypothetical protein